MVSHAGVRSHVRLGSEPVPKSYWKTMTVRRVSRPHTRSRVAPSPVGNLLKSNVTAWYAEWKARKATAAGLPAGQVLKSSFKDDDDPALRIAFDFDGVLADDASERIYQSGGLDQFQQHEATNVVTPLDPGPLRDFLAGVNRIQRVAEDRVRVSVVTARSAPAHERAINSLKAWGLTVNDAFFLGGLKKAPILDVLKPHIFFDDQRGHLIQTVPCVHIPFGVTNE